MSELIELPTLLSHSPSVKHFLAAVFDLEFPSSVIDSLFYIAGHQRAGGTLRSPAYGWQKGLIIMAKHTLFVVPGTWEVPAGVTYDTPIGLLVPYATEVNRDVFDVRFVNYPASFGPMPAEGADPWSALGEPSYAESRDMGIAELKRLINETPGTFGLVGFSQGGAVVDLVVRALVEGDMRHRLADCRWAHVFASPHRAKGKTFHLDDPNRLQFEGIAGDPVTNTGSIDYFAYAIADDAYTNIDLANTYGKEIYNRATQLATQSPDQIFASLNNISALLNFLASDGGIGIPNLTKLINTGEAALRHQNSGAHGRYNDPAVSYFGGMTAVRHSLNHLNYWGPRI